MECEWHVNTSRDGGIGGGRVVGLPDLCQDGRCGSSGGGLVGRLGAGGRGLLSRARSRVRKAGGPGGYGAGRYTRGIRGSW